MTPSLTPSILGRLRAVAPKRTITFGEALRIAELQASKLVELLDPDAEGISAVHIGGLPRIRVAYELLPVSGSSHWNGREWIIAIAQTDSLVRQRFTLLHEFKHIVDHGTVHRLTHGGGSHSTLDQAEMVADFFAGCALVPKRQLKLAWGNRIQSVADLASHFGVSEPAIRVRLAQTGLDTAIDRLPAARCARPVSTPSSQGQRFRVARPSYSRRRTA